MRPNFRRTEVLCEQGSRNASGKQPRKYVGPDTEETRNRIASHGRAKSDYRERRRLISMLRQSGMRGPPEEAGRIIQTLADAGVFRMRARLVGTAAYQVYGPMLGVRLPRSSLQTQDLDIAQFTAISVAITKDERTPPLLEILQKSDSSFRSVPNSRKDAAATTYANASGFRVEILTESRSPEREAPTNLPAIGTHAQPLRLMDFLIRDEVRAAVLYGAGILVNVPSPERYALHKLILAQRRQANPAKINKDVEQAEVLLGVLVSQNASALPEAWHEAFGRGPKWQRLLATGLSVVEAKVRDQVLRVAGTIRSIVPGLNLHFTDARPSYDLDRDIVAFPAQDSGGERVLCAISREALADHFGTVGRSDDERIEAFRRHRSEIERMAREVYLHNAVPPDGTVLVKASDVQDLLRRSTGRKPRGPSSRTRVSRKPVRP